MTTLRLTNKTSSTITLKNPEGANRDHCSNYGPHMPIWGPQTFVPVREHKPDINPPLGRGSFLRSQVFYKLDWATECPETEFLFYFFHISHTSKRDEMAWTFYHQFQPASKISLL